MLVGVVFSCLQQSVSDRRSAPSCQEMSENCRAPSTSIVVTVTSLSAHGILLVYSCR